MKRKLLLALFSLVALSGCIVNDLPYPVIAGNVLKIEIEGAEETKIDAINRVVNVTLSDTVDLRRVLIENIEITPDSRSTLQSGDILNLTDSVSYAIGEPYHFTISTFQDYEWQIVAKQPIVREVVVSGSIGSAYFDDYNKKVIVNVDANQDLKNITVKSFRLAPSCATYFPDPYTTTNFSRPVEFIVEYFGIEELWKVELQLSSENVITGAHDTWARFAYLSGDVLPGSAKEAGFEYKRSSDESWQRVVATPKSGTIEALIKDLDPDVTYTYRAFLGEEYGEERNFITDGEPIVPNLNFNEAYQSGSTWYFNASGGNSYWATGNEGIKTAGKAPNTVSVDDAVEGKAVKMSTYNGILLVSVAAGNLFTGVYNTIMSGDPREAAKSAVMGRPYTGRPTKLSGWYKYTPEIITAKSYWAKAATEYGINFADSVGKKDWAQIYMVLEKWPAGVTARPSEDMIERIAYGEFRTNEKTTEYGKFEIPLEYFDTKTKPNHIVIVASSSLNGGYFCGAAGSELFVDEFELSFDYLEPEQ